MERQHNMHRNIGKAIGSRKSEVGSRESEVASWESEDRIQKLEVGSWNSELVINNQFPATRNQPPIIHNKEGDETPSSTKKYAHNREPQTHDCPNLWLK